MPLPGTGELSSTAAGSIFGRNNTVLTLIAAQQRSDYGVEIETGWDGVPPAWPDPADRAAQICSALAVRLPPNPVLAAVEAGEHLTAAGRRFAVGSAAVQDWVGPTSNQSQPLERNADRSMPAGPNHAPFLYRAPSF